MEREAGLLASLVWRHQVIYDVYPARTVQQGHARTIGYDLEVSGVDEDGEHGHLPGCERCQRVWDDLHELARSIRPTDLARVSTYEVRHFDFALHTRPSAPTRDEVRLVVEVRHRRDELAAADACEERCLHEMTANLRAVGAQEHHWSRRDAPAEVGGAP